MIFPMRDIVVIKKDEVKEKTDGGILLPVEAHQDSDQGVVVAVGNKVVDVKVGDKVLFNSKAAYEYKTDGNDIIMMRQHHLYGVIEGSGFVQSFHNW